MTTRRFSPCKPPRNLRAAGISYLGAGCAFLSVAWFAHQPGFLGVGCAFVGLGAAWIVRGRDGR